MDPFIVLSFVGVLLLGFMIGRITATPAPPRGPSSRLNTLESVPHRKPGTDPGRTSMGIEPEATGPDADIEELIRNGRIINAIKLYRNRYDVGLREAKDAVEAMAERLQ